MKFSRLHIAAVVALVVVFAPLGATAATPGYVQELVEQADAAELADHPQWHALLHYRPRTFGGVRSDIDSPQFFLHEEGPTDPQGELEATLAAFFLPAFGATGDYHPDTEHPQCRFRARFEWLNGKLEFDEKRLDVRDCDDFDDWRDGVDGESATLIFAASHLSNPASMFGHTLMRLDRGEGGYAAELDSYVVNVTAEPWTYNPVLYIAMGLTGGFDGVFDTLPFDRKVQKYIDREHRELWEYELDFDDDQFDRLVRHLWELKPVNMDYRYFDENCSYFLLSLMEVANPSLQLVEHFSFHVLPGDTVRVALEAEGLIGERGFRPSSRQAMLAKRQRLTGEEVELAERLGDRESEAAVDELDDLDERRRAYVLEAAHALWRYRNPPDEETGAVDSDFARLLRQLRDELDVETPPVDPAVRTAPEDGHATARLDLTGGADATSSGFFEFGIRPALHDLAGPDLGYQPLSQLEFLHTRIRGVGIERELAWPTMLLQRLDVVNVMSLAPLDRWTRNWSWALKTGLERSYADGCGDAGCLFYDAVMGFGGTVELGPLAGYLLVDGQLAFGSNFDSNVRLGAGPRAGTLLRMGQFARLHLEGRYRYPLWGEGFPDPIISTGSGGPPWSAQGTLSVSAGRNLEARANGVVARGRAEATLGLLLYF